MLQIASSRQALTETRDTPVQRTEAPTAPVTPSSNRLALASARAIQRDTGPDEQPSRTVTTELFSPGIVSSLALASIREGAAPAVTAVTQWVVNGFTPIVVDGIISLGKRTLDASGVLQAAGSALLSQKGLVDSLVSYVAGGLGSWVWWLHAGVKVLKNVVDGWSVIPESARAPMLYMVGRALYKLDGAFGGWINPFSAERVNRLLIDVTVKDARTLVDWLDWLATKLERLRSVLERYEKGASDGDDNAVERAMVDLLGDLFRWGTGYDLPGLRNSVVAWASRKLMSWVLPGSTPEALPDTKQDPTTSVSEDTSTDSPSTDSPDKADTSLVKQDWRFLSLQVEKPRLERFDDTAGLILGGTVVFHLFGADLGASNDLKLPFGGGFEYRGVVRMRVPSGGALTPAFGMTEIGGKIVLTDQGLQRAAVWMMGVSLAGDTLKDGYLRVTWTPADGLVGTLKATVGIGDGIQVLGALHLDPSGRFQRGALEVKSMGAVSLVPGWLELEQPGFQGALARNGDLLIRVFAERVASPGIGLTVIGPEVGYETGKGLYASATGLTLEIGNLTVESDGLRIDKEGLELRAASFLYDYDRNKVDEQEAQATRNIGLDSRILSKTPLDRLVVAGRLTGVRVSKKGIVATGLKASATRAEEPLLDAGSEPRTASKTSEEQPSGVEETGVLEETTPQGRVAVDRLGIGAFGFRGEADFRKREASLAGSLSVAPKLPGLALKLPLPPAGAAYINAEITPIVRLRGELGAHGAISDRSQDVARLEVGQKAGVRGDFGVEAKLGVGVGIPYLLAVEGNLTAGVLLETAGDFDLVLLLDYHRDTGALDPDSVTGTWKASAVLVLEVGADVTVQALFIFKKKLLSRKLKRWELGKVEASGAFEKGRKGGVATTGSMPIKTPAIGNTVPAEAPAWDALNPGVRRDVLEQVRKGEIEALPLEFAKGIRESYLPQVYERASSPSKSVQAEARREVQLWSVVLHDAGIAARHMDDHGNVDVESAKDEIRQEADRQEQTGDVTQLRASGGPIQRIPLKLDQGSYHPMTHGAGSTVESDELSPDERRTLNQNVGKTLTPGTLDLVRQGWRTAAANVHPMAAALSGKLDDSGKKAKAARLYPASQDVSSLTAFLAGQEDWQTFLKDQKVPMSDVLSTHRSFGMEYEFATWAPVAKDDVPSHTEVGQSYAFSPLFGIPFVLETDAQEELELVAPPMLAGDVDGGVNKAVIAAANRLFIAELVALRDHNEGTRVDRLPLDGLGWAWTFQADARKIKVSDARTKWGNKKDGIAYQLNIALSTGEIDEALKVVDTAAGNDDHADVRNRLLQRLVGTKAYKELSSGRKKAVDPALHLLAKGLSNAIVVPTLNLVGATRSPWHTGDLHSYVKDLSGLWVKDSVPNTVIAAVHGDLTGFADLQAILTDVRGSGDLMVRDIKTRVPKFTPSSATMTTGPQRLALAKGSEKTEDDGLKLIALAEQEAHACLDEIQRRLGGGYRQAMVKNEKVDFLEDDQGKGIGVRQDTYANLGSNRSGPLHLAELRSTKATDEFLK